MRKTLIIVAVVLLITNAATFFTGVEIGIRGMEIRVQEENAMRPNYTGQQIQDAVNNYRKEKGIAELKVNTYLCSDLIERYLAFQTEAALKEGHPGFETWARGKFKEGFSIVGEVYSSRVTVQKVIDGWKASPGHNEAITNQEYTEICTYAGPEGVVVVLGAE
jgi:hypothetical protein